MNKNQRSINLFSLLCFSFRFLRISRHPFYLHTETHTTNAPHDVVNVIDYKIHRAHDFIQNHWSNNESYYNSFSRSRALSVCHTLFHTHSRLLFRNFWFMASRQANYNNKHYHIFMSSFFMLFHSFAMALALFLTAINHFVHLKESTE